MFLTCCIVLPFPPYSFSVEFARNTSLKGVRSQNWELCSIFSVVVCSLRRSICPRHLKVISFPLCSFLSVLGPHCTTQHATSVIATRHSLQLSTDFEAPVFCFQSLCFLIITISSMYFQDYLQPNVFLSTQGAIVKGLDVLGLKGLVVFIGLI